MHCLSIGDQVECGTYTLHSRFQRAANFIDGTRMVFVVTEDIGAGPVNLVVSALETLPCGPLIAGATEIAIAGRAIGLSNANRYRSELPSECASAERFARNLVIFGQVLAEAAPAASLVFLIDPKRLGAFQTPFERELVCRISRGTDALFACDWLRGIATLKGCGVGLTPGGDDFIAGLLIGMNLRQRLWQEDWHNAIESTFAVACGNNALSNTFLDMARRGCVSERMKRSIAALLGEDEMEVRAATHALIAMGATSGADMATGVYMMMRRKVVNETRRARSENENVRFLGVAPGAPSTSSGQATDGGASFSEVSAR